MAVRLSPRDRLLRTVTETSWQETVELIARSRGWRFIHVKAAVHLPGGKVVHVTPYNPDAKGWPDLVLFKGGCRLAAELKTETGQPTDEQLEWLSILRAAGFVTYVWRPRDRETVLRVLGGVG